MSDIRNLIYNGDFSKGKDGWYSSGTTDNSDITISNGALIMKHTNVANTSIINDNFIPINADDTYRLSFDMKLDAAGSSSNKYFYIRLDPYDSKKEYISITSTYRYPTNSNTTLAAALKNGDTTITVANAANFYKDTVSYYKYIGICDNIAWGYNRCTRYARYTSISGNVITLASAWTGGSYEAGTKVACFRDGSTNYYPWYDQVANMPTGWFHKSVTFKGSNVRFSTQYVRFATYGYDHDYSLRNIRIENISRTQINPNNEDVNSSNNGGTLDIHANTSITSSEEVGMNVRYIKDFVNGSSKNGLSHWVEIKALDSHGINVAYNKKSKFGNESSYDFHLCTDGSTATSPYDDPGTITDCTVDLGFIAKITEIHVWHYWYDGRTYYDHTVSVSEDGTNWDIVYQGEQPETKDGIKISIQSKKNTLHKSGLLSSNKIIEY